MPCAGELIDPVRTPPVPRYFMLNDRSGYLALGVSDRPGEQRGHARGHPRRPGSARLVDVRDFSKPDGHGSVITGQLIRMVNVGVVVHQMHFHGNHVWTVRRNGVDFPRAAGRIDAEGHVLLQQWEDVVELDPLDRKEVVLPLRRPPDTTDAVWAARDRGLALPDALPRGAVADCSRRSVPRRPGGRLGARSPQSPEASR